MSYITVPAEKVIQCCNNWKLYTNISRCQNAAKYVKEKAKDKEYWLWGNPIGYQKAFEFFMQDGRDCFSNLKFHACFWENKNDDDVKNLLILAKNGDPVIVTDKHAFIFNFENIDFEKVE